MYVKLYQYANCLEIYKYEKSPLYFYRKSKRKNRRSALPFSVRFARNSTRAKQSFLRLIKANLPSPRGNPALLTLTTRDVYEIRKGWLFFTQFASRCRYRYGSRFAYAVVPEFQKRGAVHFHLLVWGLTDDEIYKERETRSIASLWPHGFVDIRPSDGSFKLAGYLGKYMVKAMSDFRLFGVKSYACSRSLVRPVVAVIKESWDLIESEVVDNSLVLEREKTYNTQWLGSCNYQSLIR